MIPTNSSYIDSYLDRGIWELWHDKTWDDYVHKKYRKEVQKLVETESDNNVLLYGANGLGKSMLLNLAMKDFLHSGKEVYVIDFRNLVKEYAKSWRGEGKLNRLLKVDYLGIDDLGKEFDASGMSKDLAITTIDYVFRYRFQRKKPTWVTFNMPLASVKENYNEDIASLFKRNTTAIAFKGDDYGDTLIKMIK